MNNRIAELEAQVKELQEQLKAQEEAQESLLEYVIPRQEFYNLLRVCKEDSQSKDLLREIWCTLSDRVSVSGSDKNALNRLRNLLGRTPSYSPLTRNQIFKIANELGIKLPSSFF